MVTERGPDYKVLQMTNVLNGTNCVHKITVLATGLNYTNPATGQLVESSEAITLQPDGTAVASQGRHTVQFPSDIYDGVLQVTTPDGRNLYSRPLCVCLDDGSNTVVIATLTNSIGYLTASNQVTYFNCWSGISGDLVCDYKRSGFECSLVFRAQPPTPDQFGLDASFTTLQLVTEFFNTQDPQQIPSASDDWFGLQDDTLKFGKLTMTRGKAFAFGNSNTNSGPSAPNSTPVYKSWVRTDDGRRFLVEQVPLAYVANSLAALPLTAMGGSTGAPPVPVGAPPTGTGKDFHPHTTPIILANASAQPRAADWDNPRSSAANVPHLASLLSHAGKTSIANPATLSSRYPASTFHASRCRVFPPSHGILTDTNHILLAADFKQIPGFVLDYTEIINGGTFSDMTFGPGTWVVAGPIYCSNVVVQGGAVFKYATGYSIELDGPLTCPAPTDPPAYFTAVDDDSVGDSLNGVYAGYTGVIQSPYGQVPYIYGGYGNPVFSVPSDPGWPEYGNPIDVNLENVRIRYANTVISLNYETFAGFSDSQITGCGQVAVLNDGGSADSSDMVGVGWNNCLLSTNLYLVVDNTAYGCSYGLTDCTIDNCQSFSLWDGNGMNTYGNLSAINCVFSSSGQYAEDFSNFGSGNNGFYNCPPGTPGGSFPFVTAANGTANYYLTANSPFHGAGTTANMDPNLLADLQTKTTYAPQDGGAVDAAGTDLGYHYSVSENSGFGSLPDSWLYHWFGNYSHKASDLDSTGHTLLYDYQHNLDPNVIAFSVSAANNYVNTSTPTLQVNVIVGFPAYYAVLVDDSNLGDAVWQPYTSSSLTVNLGSTQGSHDVRVGLKGIAANATATWEDTTLVLDTSTPAIAITGPANNSTFNTTRVNVTGTFSGSNVKQITVNGVPAYLNGSTFEAMNVPLAQGANTVTATLQNLAGATASATITVNRGTTQVDPVQLSVTPSAGFTPLAVTFTATANVPGTLQQVLYDFTGNDASVQTATDLNPVSYTYSSAGEYFPVVTVVTDAGRFSSSGGWNSSDPNRLQVNVQSPPTGQNFVNVIDPVDLKCDASGNLYVLSGSTATITEYNSSGVVIRSLANIGTNPQGLDVDSAGNVYVAMTGNNQVWKFNPTTGSFTPDTTFGNAGKIGVFDGEIGPDAGQFNSPYDVAVSPDGSEISVSDSGNNRIQQFTSAGQYKTSFGTYGSAVGQFNTPQGVAYDKVGVLYIVDSGNSRIAVAQNGLVQGTTGSSGTGLGQFSTPVNVCISTRGVYVADTGNSRIQAFSLPKSQPLSITPASTRFAFTDNFNQPSAVAAVNNLLNDQFFVADTGNNRVILCTVPNPDPDAILAVWNNMVSHVNSSDFVGASSYFSVASVDNYMQTFQAVGAANAVSAINQIGTLTPVYVNSDRAEYYFTSTSIINGQSIGFPVEFDKENGVWKILEF